MSKKWKANWHRTKSTLILQKFWDVGQFALELFVRYRNRQMINGFRLSKSCKNVRRLLSKNGMWGESILN